MEEIDFVLPWVDGGDPAWLASKRLFETRDMGASSTEANSACRYRDNGLLRFWFRGIEQYAPWVRTVHFVTCGQIPAWLDDHHPKLHLVNHSDFIPEEYLPTFNANTIELNFHRIEDLSEQFVYFNDDMFLLRSISPDFFFSGSDPVLDTSLRYSEKVGYNNWSRLIFNDYCVVNSSFNIGKSIWNNRSKWFSIKELGYKQSRRNFLCFLANRTLPVGLYGHIALPHLKSTFQEIWNRYPDIMDTACRHKLRSDDQVNQWLCCAWNQATGRFYPARPYSRGRVFGIKSENVEWICQVIMQQEYPQVCLNEDEKTTDADRCYELFFNAFSCILPDKSSFELD